MSHISLSHTGTSYIPGIYTYILLIILHVLMNIICFPLSPLSSPNRMHPSRKAHSRGGRRKQHPRCECAIFQTGLVDNSWLTGGDDTAGDVHATTATTVSHCLFGYCRSKEYSKGAASCSRCSIRGITCFVSFRFFQRLKICSRLRGA